MRRRQVHNGQTLAYVFDLRLTALMRGDAARLGLPVYEVDGSRSEDETEQDLAEHFAAAIERRPRIRDGVERAAIRRAENAVVLVQLDAFRAYLGETAPSPATEPAAIMWLAP